ncbi:MAG: hypothetical protein L0H63_04090 [Nitrococcus sp.]|nr:hypothetical protein [Nitrococcus sp.]
MNKRTEQCQPPVDVPHALRSKPYFLFGLPWDIHEVGGVNEVVRNLIRELNRDGRFTPLLLMVTRIPRGQTPRGSVIENQLRQVNP